MSPVLIPSSVEIPAPRSADQLMESFMVFPKDAKDLNKIDFITKFISTHIISYGEFEIFLQKKKLFLFRNSWFWHWRFHNTSKDVKFNAGSVFEVIWNTFWFNWFLLKWINSNIKNYFFDFMRTFKKFKSTSSVKVKTNSYHLVR